MPNLFTLIFKNENEETKEIECSSWVTSHGDIYAWTENGSVCIRKQDWFLYDVK